MIKYILTVFVAYIWAISTVAAAAYSAADKTVDELYAGQSFQQELLPEIAPPSPTSENFWALFEIYNDIIYINQAIKRSNIAQKYFQLSPSLAETIRKYQKDGNEQEFISRMKKQCLACIAEDIDKGRDEAPFQFTPENSSLCRRMAEQKIFMLKRPDHLFAQDIYKNNIEIMTKTEGTAHNTSYYAVYKDGKEYYIRYFWSLNDWLTEFEKQIYLVSTNREKINFNIYKFNPDYMSFEQACKLEVKSLTFKNTIASNDSVCNKIINEQYFSPVPIPAEEYFSAADFEQYIKDICHIEHIHYFQGLQKYHDCLENQKPSVVSSNTSIHGKNGELINIDIDNDGKKENLLYLNYASGAGAGCDETFYAEYIPQNTNVDYIFSGLEPHCGGTLKRPVTIDHTNYILTVMEDRPKKLYRLYKDTEGKKQKELICNFEAVPKYY